MAASNSRPRHALCLLLLLSGTLLSHVNTTLVMKTSNRSESEVFLPDEQLVHLLFWVEEAGGAALLGTEGMEQEDHFKTEGDDKDKEKGKKNGKKNRNVMDVSEEEEDYDDHEDDSSATIAITYFVSVFQYQTISFNASERSVWLSTLFSYNLVDIPVASLSFNPVPPSWWGRRVKVWSEPTVYWYLCPSPDQCAPGKPPHFLHTPDAHPILVIVFGATSAVLLLLCLGLAALVLYLRRKPSPKQSRHWLSRADTIAAHQFTTRC
ncbi:uncharacterized protein LOC123506061 isoform X1 [Portunus trituberculatus]|nr:uncharacterized protein LOC123506061 isoform X1 [Portunus trituberculatus]